MPNLKRINGHTKTMRPILYLVREDRALAVDCVNCEWLDDSGKPVWEQMDETRDAFGNDEPKNGKPVRRYQHVIISPDPRDEVSLEQLRELVTRWLEELFPQYQSVIAYHDDNFSGILHAHIIINNTNLETGRRISYEMQGSKNRLLDEALQRISREMGLRHFRTTHDDAALPEDAEMPESPGVAGEPVRREPRGKAEEEIAERGGYVWKDDIRERVHAAVMLSRDEGEFVQSCAAMGIGVSSSKSKRRANDWVYEMESHPTWRVTGARLGAGLSRWSVERRLAEGRLYKRTRPPVERARAIRAALVSLEGRGARLGYLGTVSDVGVTAKDVARMVERATKEDIRSMADWKEVALAASGAERRAIIESMSLARALGCYPEARDKSDGRRAPIGRMTDEQRERARRQGSGREQRAQSRQAPIGTEHDEGRQRGEGR